MPAGILGRAGRLIESLRAFANSRLLAGWPDTRLIAPLNLLSFSKLFMMPTVSGKLTQLNI